MKKEISEDPMVTVCTAAVVAEDDAAETTELELIVGVADANVEVSVGNPVDDGKLVDGPFDSDATELGVDKEVELAPSVGGTTLVGTLGEAKVLEMAESETLAGAVGSTGVVMVDVGATSVGTPADGCAVTVMNTVVWTVTT